MEDKRHELKDNRLIIIDKELGLFIDEPFTLPFIPSDLSKTEVDGCQLKVERDFSGSLKEVYLEKNGLLNGQKCLYYERGRIRARMFYRDGRLHGPSVYYSKEGLPLSKTWFYNGVKQGIAKLYYLTGKLYSVQSFLDGKREKKQFYYHENQNLKTVMYHKKGLLEGEVVIYWPSGKIRRRCFFSDGKKEGTDEIYNEDGSLVISGEYKGNTAVGLHKKWDEKGELISQTRY